MTIAAILGFSRYVPSVLAWHNNVLLLRSTKHPAFFSKPCLACSLLQAKMKVKTKMRMVRMCMHWLCFW